MGAKQLDLIGLRYNNLFVLEKLPSKAFGKSDYKKRMWLCVCDCGNKTEVSTGDLTTGHTASCGCLHSKMSVENSLKSRHKIVKKDSAYKQIYSIYKRSAKDKNYTLNINFDYFVKLLKSNCFYCGIQPSRLYHKSVYQIYYNGIDRVDNNLGYEHSNVVTCCRMCNVAKNNNTKDEFLNWASRLYKHQNYLEVLIQKEEHLK